MHFADIIKKLLTTYAQLYVLNELFDCIGHPIKKEREKGIIQRISHSDSPAKKEREKKRRVNKLESNENL